MREHSLILSILRNNSNQYELKSTNLSSIEWDVFLKKVFCEGVAGVVYSKLRNSNVKKYFPKKVMLELEEFYIANLGRNIVIYKELESIFKALKEERIDCFINRGAYFSKYIYSDLGERAMADVDFIIFSEDLKKFKNAVMSIGYSYFKSYPFFFYKNGVYIDLHLDKSGFWRINDWPCGFTIRDPDIQARSVFFHSDFPNIKVFDTYDIILGCCQHLQEHSFSKLIWFIDIVKLVESKGKSFEWEVLERRAENFNLKKPLYFVIEYLIKNNLIFLKSYKGKNHIILNFLEKKTLNLILADKRDYVCGWLLFIFLIRGVMNKLSLFKKVLFLKKDYIPLSRKPDFFHCVRRSLGIIGYVIKMAIAVVLS